MQGAKTLDGVESLCKKLLGVRKFLNLEASANLFSLVMSCRANDIEPYAYLCYLLEEFPKATTAEQLEALLPWNAKTAIAAATVAARTGLAA